MHGRTNKSISSQLKYCMSLAYKQNTLCVAKCFSSVLLGGIMFYLGVWLSVVKQHYLLWWNFIFFPTRMHGWGTSLLSFTVWLNELLVLCLVYSPKLYIWLFTSSELKVRKHFQIELHGCNQYSGDRWRVWTRPLESSKIWCDVLVDKHMTHTKAVWCACPRDETPAELKPRRSSCVVHTVWMKWHHGVRLLSRARCYLSPHHRCCAGLGPSRRGDVTPHGFSMI